MTLEMDAAVTTRFASSAGRAARWVGKSVNRKEDQRLLTGHGRFVDDVRVHGMLHAAFVRSEVASATIDSIDARAALALDGVVAVLTATDFEGRYTPVGHAMLGGELLVPAPLADGDVRHVGDPIALVVATSRYVAEDACDLVQVALTPREPVVDYRRAAADTEHVVHAGWGLESNVMMAVPFTPMGPDFSGALRDAKHTVSRTVLQNRYLCVPMETRGIVVDYVPGSDEFDIYCSCQGTHGTRNFLARYLDVPEARIRVSARDVGGGFGQKMFVFREECAIVLAAQRLGRAVKWIEDRRENLIAAAHSRNEQGTVTLALDDDGTIEAIAIDHVADVGAYPVAPAAMDPLLLTGPYRIPNMGFASTLAWTNTMGKGAYRGPWLFETTAREVAIDQAARQLGIDPVEIRRRNMVRRTEQPYAMPSGHVLRDVTPLETLEQAIEMLGYEDFRASQAAARAEGRLVGLGISCYVEPTAMSLPTLATEGATIRVESSGTVVAFLSTTSHGQSIETTMAQLVADELGVDLDDVTIVQADTQSTPYGPGTGGSRTAVVAGGAIREASRVLRERIQQVAAHLLEADPADIAIEDGEAFVSGVPSVRHSLGELATAAFEAAETLPAGADLGLEARARFRPSQLPTWSNATHVCVVEIDRDTCIPEIKRFIVSEDCGPMINPRVVEGQIFGGVVQGIGGVLLEDFVYDHDGNPLSSTLVDYLLPTITEVPAIEVGHIQTPAMTNAEGFKGCGEGGAIGAHAAVMNAVADALAPLGVEVTTSPLGPADIHRLLIAAEATTTSTNASQL
jgi:carbon-monoxide dehydrogenase large subunit